VIIEFLLMVINFEHPKELCCIPTLNISDFKLITLDLDTNIIHTCPEETLHSVVVCTALNQLSRDI